MDRFDFSGFASKLLYSGVFFSLQVASGEELKRLEKEVREQEQLLTGYQLENERLYKELKQMQAKEKTSEARMFSENQKLGKKKFVCSQCVLPTNSLAWLWWCVDPYY